MTLLKYADIPLRTGELSVDLRLPPGSINCLVGPNGAGKSSFFSFLKQEKISAGNPWMFVDQLGWNVLGERRGRDLLDLLKGLPNFDPRVFDQLVGEFEFRAKLERPIKLLSGGEKQILKILAALAVEAKVYFLDEPFNHLDALNVGRLQGVLRQMVETRKCSFLLIDHDLERDLALAHHIYEMKPAPHGRLEVVPKHGGANGGH